MCASLHGCKQKLGKASSCLLVNDLANLDKGFHPRDLNCSSYSGVYSNSPVVDNLKAYEFGTRISFDVPDHVPNICEECEKPNGHCGVGLRCICHPKECSKYSLLLQNLAIDSLSFFFLVLFLHVVHL